MIVYVIIWLYIKGLLDLLEFFQRLVCSGITDVTLVFMQLLVCYLINKANADLACFVDFCDYSLIDVFEDWARNLRHGHSSSIFLIILVCIFTFGLLTLVSHAECLGLNSLLVDDLFLAKLFDLIMSSC